MKDDKKPATRDELILEVWERLDCESVGSQELRQIQAALAEKFGPGAVDSPAAIARLLADQGAVLRHPEILDFDTEWREKRLRSFGTMDFSSLSGAVIALNQAESLRKCLEETGARSELSRLYDFVNEVRDGLALVILNKTTSDAAQAEAAEILEWLSLWRRSPGLFPDWLELRLASVGFRLLFPNFPNA
jgi:hypothetical protein